MAKTKIKPILPSLREKKRYVAFEAISAQDVDFKKAQDDITQALREIYGSLGASKISPMFFENKWDSKSKRGIIKVGHRHVDEIKAVFAAANSKDRVYRSLGVSGILKKAQSKFIKNKTE